MVSYYDYSMSSDDKEIIELNRPLLRGFEDGNNIPEANQSAAAKIVSILDKFNIHMANVDLETDLYNTSIKQYLKAYYGNGLSREEIIDMMKNKKAENMYGFLRTNKSKLSALINDNIAKPLIAARDYIVSRYGAY